MRKVSYDKKMVHSAYSHITVITLLAFAAINGVRGKPAHVIERLTNVENKTLEIITNLAGAEGRLQTIKERIFSQNPTSRGVIEKHLDCLETAYTYSWGEVVFNTLAQRLPHCKLNISNRFCTCSLTYHHNYFASIFWLRKLTLCIFSREHVN
uniref:Uncharacterized protein n=1 Tax=Trichobilharzia regenti TaxID=157069 RepID=A0AA85J4B3_TRIRE|nr:unnamed protein product [Trichobilharzia regenti]